MREAGLQSVVALAGTSSSLADRLRRERHLAFIGREQEIEQLELSLEHAQCALLFLSGQAGSGKTSVLLEYERLCLEEQRAVVFVDAASFAAASVDERNRLQRQWLNQLGDTVRVRAQLRPVLLVDAYERLGGAESWLLNQLAPELPSDTLLVFASRHPPPLQLLLDPAWGQLMRTHEISPWSEDDALQFLQAHAVPRSAHDSLLELCGGYPLALALCVGALRRGAEPPASPRHVRELQAMLGQVLLPSAVSRGQQLALDVCALARVTTLELLEHVLRANAPSQAENAPELFKWLTNLSFIRRERIGLCPHELARTALIARVHREHPQNYSAVYRPVREFCVEQLAAETGESTFDDLFFLDRDLPFVRRLQAPNRTQDEPGLEPASREDRSAIVELVRSLEGDDSAELVHARSGEGMHSFEVLRSEQSGAIDAIMQVSTLTQASDVRLPERDPAARLARQFVLEHPLENGAEALFFRWFADREDYQSPRGRVLAVSARQARLVLTNSRVAYVLGVFHDPQEWVEMWESANVPKELVGRFQLGAREYSLFAFFYQDHSLRELLIDAWQARSAANAPKPSGREDPAAKIRQRVAELGRNINLTARELQILELICLGTSFEEIAAQLRIRPRTVKFHQENVLRKVGVGSRVELFRKLI